MNTEVHIHTITNQRYKTIRIPNWDAKTNIQLYSARNKTDMNTVGKKLHKN